MEDCPQLLRAGDYSAEEGLSWQFKYNLRF